MVLTPLKGMSLVKGEAEVEDNEDPVAGPSSSSTGRKSRKRKTAERSGGGDDVASTITTTEGNTTGLVLNEGNQEEWMVEKVLGKYLDLDGKLWYRIKWEGWDSKWNSWEPVEHLENSKDLIDQFEERNKKRELRAALKKKSKKSEEDPVPEPPSVVQVDPGDVASSLDFVSQESVEESQRERSSTPITPTRMDEAVEVDESDASCILAEDEESAKLESDDDETEMEAQKKLHGPQFRRLWRKDETPLAIVGSAMFHNTLVHLIRLRPQSDEEAEQVLQDPHKGLNPQNFVFIPSSNFHRRYPRMLIEYYEKFTAYTNVLPSSSNLSD